jgi:hypothetical protein
VEWKKLHMRNLIICTTYQIEKNEIGGACSTYGGEEIFIQGFDWET